VRFNIVWSVLYSLRLYNTLQTMLKPTQREPYT